MRYRLRVSKKLLRFLLPILAVLVNNILLVILHRYFGIQRGIFLFSSTTILLASLYGGPKVGLYTFGLSLGVAEYLYLHNLTQPSVEKIFLALIFIIHNLVVIYLIWRIHQHKQLLDSAHEKTIRTNRFMYSILDGIKDPLVVLNKNFIIQYASPAAVKVLKNQYKERQKFNDISIWEALPMSRGTEFEKALRQAKKTKKTTTFEYIDENVHHHWEVVFYPIPTGIMVYARDIENRTILDQRKTDFISALAHDIKNPLASVKIMTQLLAKKLQKQDHDLVKFTDAIDRQTEKMINMVNNLLDVSRIRSGKMILNLTPVRIADVVSGAVETVSYAHPKHKIIIKGNVKHVLNLDRYRIVQALENILTNAIKYSPNSSQIILQIEKKQHDLIFSVQDFGIGIPEDELDKIFDRFYQTDNKNSGLGMGLFISHKIIQEHGGTMWAKSKLGEGSTFYFSLPC